MCIFKADILVWFPVVTLVCKEFFSTCLLVKGKQQWIDLHIQKSGSSVRY